MSYQRQWYAPQGWYEEQGASNAPGMTPTNAEKALAAAQQLAYMQAHPELYAYDAATKTWTKRAVPLTTTTSSRVKTIAKVAGIGVGLLIVLGVVYVARKI